MSAPKIALVTGASSGFGQLTAASLADKGYRVFGTSRRAHSTPSNEIGMLRLDVRSDDSVRSCVEQVMAQVDRIDVLVNNAGQIHASVVEETSLEQAKDVLETNFWGAVRVTDAVLPIMRRQRQGHIINMIVCCALVSSCYVATHFDGWRYEGGRLVNNGLFSRPRFEAPFPAISFNVPGSH